MPRHRPIAAGLRLAAAALLLAGAAGCAGVRPLLEESGTPATRPRAHITQTGLASFYARAHQGRRTASGESFDSRQLTAAHRTLPFGTQVRVTNLDNGRAVVVRINDRGPFKGRRIIDLSYAAAQRLGFVGRGLARVRLETI